jgi:menaquinone-dependent protoporphyrinogen IX oxidase
MRILVVYYSRTGLTKKIATLISTKIKADLDEIIDKKDRSGPIGYMKAGKDAMKNALTTITSSINPKEYDLIIIGGPVWAWTMAPAIRTYLDQNADALRVEKVAFFATQSSDGAEKKFKAMEEMLKMKPLATLTINGKDLRSEVHVQKVNAFIDSLRI